MEPAVVENTEGEVMILEQILFEFDRDQTKEESSALVELGVAVERLKPIASKNSEEGRAKNRRVRFIILEPNSEEDDSKSAD